MISEGEISELNCDYGERNISIFCAKNETSEALDIYFNLDQISRDFLDCLKINPDEPLHIKLLFITLKVKISNAGILESPLKTECKVFESLKLSSACKQIFKNVTKWIENPTHKCASCFKNMDFQGVLPIVCDDAKCKFYQSEINPIELHNVIHNEPEVFDLLWSLFYTAIKHNIEAPVVISKNKTPIHAQNKITVLPVNKMQPKNNEQDIPTKYINKEKELLMVMSLLPSVTDLQEVDIVLLEKHIRDKHADLPYIMRWVIGSVRYGIKWNGNEFKIFNENPEKMAQFKIQAKNNKVVNGFHGSAITNWHAIFKSSLQNMSGTSKQAYGAAYGSGIYLGKTKETSMNYVGRKGIEWPNSQFIGRRLMVEVDVVHNQIKDVKGFCYVVENEDKVVMKKILLV